jgi:hypothetical protein
MKLPTTSLLAVALAAMGFAGCETQSSSPLAASPAKKPMAQAPKTPAETKPLRKKDDPFWSEERPRTQITGPLIQASAEIPDVASPATETKPPEKPTIPDSAGTRPKADREPTKPGDPTKITFDDLILGMQKDMVFRPFMLTDRAKELDGKRVRLSGDMLAYDSKKAKEFILLRNNKCLYGQGGQADHVALVHMKEGHTIDYTSNTVRIEGNLKIIPESGSDGNTKHLYVLEDAVVK